MLADDESPNITCPSNGTNTTDSGRSYATVSLPAPDSVSDNSGVVTVTIDVNGTVYRAGDEVQLDLATSPHLLQYTATDNSMNDAMCDVYITVVGRSLEDKS